MLQQQQKNNNNTDGILISKMIGVGFVSQQNWRITFHTNQTISGAHQLKQQGLYALPLNVTVF